jgi:hypothetical protein
MTIRYMNGFEALPEVTHVRLGNGLAEDYDGDAASISTPTFTWTEQYSLADSRRYLNTYWGIFQAYMGETHPRGWLPPIRRVRLDSPALGDNLRRRARILEPWNPTTMRPPRRFWVPAKRFAGFRAYPDITPTYLDKIPSPQWSLDLFHQEVDMRSFGRWAGTAVITYPEGFGGWTHIRDVGSLRPSERRARHSSTMDGNGKPRRKKR